MEQSGWRCRDGSESILRLSQTGILPQRRCICPCAVAASMPAGFMPERPRHRLHRYDEASVSGMPAVVRDTLGVMLIEASGSLVVQHLLFDLERERVRRHGITL